MGHFHYSQTGSLEERKPRMQDSGPQGSGKPPDADGVTIVCPVCTTAERPWKAALLSLCTSGVTRHSGLKWGRTCRYFRGLGQSLAVPASSSPSQDVDSLDTPVVPKKYKEEEKEHWVGSRLPRELSSSRRWLHSLHYTRRGSHHESTGYGKMSVSTCDTRVMVFGDGAFGR